MHVLSVSCLSEAYVSFLLVRTLLGKIRTLGRSQLVTTSALEPERSDFSGFSAHVLDFDLDFPWMSKGKQACGRTGRRMP